MENGRRYWGNARNDGTFETSNIKWYDYLMGKLVGGLLLLIILFALGWRYLPADFRTRASVQFAGLVGQSEKKALEMAKDKLLPKNPRMLREELLKELKQSVKDIKARALSENPAAHNPKEQTFPELVEAAENVIQELEKANNNVSLKEKIAEKVLGAFIQEKKICDTAPN